MRKIKTTLLASVATAALGLAMAAPGASAQSPTSYDASLSQLNSSGTSGTAHVELSGTTATITLDVQGATPDAPHAQHIHGEIGLANVCPTPADDADGDGVISTAEGVPSYGKVNTSLTTSGDTSPESALAVERFPTADSSGAYRYQRTFELSQDVADDLGNLHLVVHGVDLDGSGTYDGDAPSSLDPSLPLEATAPAACGQLVQAGMTPSGGVETGAGGTADGSGGGADLAPLALAGAAGAVAVGGILVFRRRDLATR